VTEEIAGKIRRRHGVPARPAAAEAEPSPTLRSYSRR
jgi:hypothetical protein